MTTLNNLNAESHDKIFVITHPPAVKTENVLKSVSLNTHITRPYYVFK